MGEFNKDFLRQVVGIANNVCIDAFGKDCAIRESAIVDYIIDDVPIPGEAKGYTNLIEELNKVPTRMRQHLIIQIASHIHDQKSESSSDKEIELEKYRLFVHWWLIGADEIRRIVFLPEVEEVLKILTIGRKETIRPWVCPHGLHVISETTILGKDFDRVYEEYSLACQKTNDVYRENLPDRIKQGKRFYRYMPEWLAEEVQADPLISFRMSQDICKWVKVASINDLEREAAEARKERQSKQTRAARA